MKNRKLLFGIVGGLAVLIAAAGFSVWYFILRDDAPAAVSLDSAIGSLGTPTAAANASGTAAPTSAASSPTASTGGSASTGLAGTWVPDTTQNTFLGYRVVEQLANIGTNTAVGRTKVVTGSVVLTETQATSATITADLTKLASDNNLRDGQLRNQAIETNKFPNATFVLSGPVALPEGLAKGEATSVTLNGKLTLHGVTKDISVPAQAQLKDGLLVVVGSIDLKFSDYSINSPRGASVLSIDDHGIMELQLILKKS